MTSRTNKPYVSIVIPLFNEEEVLPFLLPILTKVCENLKKSYEIIMIDDGSTDQTYELLTEAAAKNNRLKALKFSRNFGHQAAFNAGLDMAQGELVITMDGDLQHPPDLIPEFIKQAEQGYHLVIGERLSNKQNSWLREWAGRNFYRFLSSITNLEFRNVSDFALYRHSVVATLKRLPEKERFLRGIVQWVGFKKKYLPYSVAERRAGQPKYTAKKLWGLIMSGVTSFSAFPLRLSFWTGLVVFIFSLGFSVYTIIDHYVDPNPLIAGWATLVVLVLMLGSIQLIVLGVVGEYLYKMFNEIKGRPQYIVAETLNVNPKHIKETPYGLHGHLI